MNANFIFFVSIAFIISACTVDKEKSTNLLPVSESSQQSPEKDTLAEQFKDVIYSVVTPHETMSLLKKAGISYKEDALHDNKKAGDYESLMARSVNLGIYGADLAYCSFLNKSQKSQLYISTIQELSQKIGIAGILNEEFIQSVAENAFNPDSLVKIGKTSNMEIYQYLIKSKRKNILALFSSGAIIENLHLAIASVDKYSKDNPLIKAISSQKITFKILQGYFNQMSDDESIQPVTNDMSKLFAFFSQVESPKSSGIIISTSKETEKQGAFDIPVITEQQFENLSALVKALRDKYTSQL